jgi:hypothetical protein
MGKADEYAAWIVANKDKRGTPEFETVARAYQASKNSPPSFFEQVKQGAGNLAAGAVRGAGSIGATILAPYDIAKDALDGKGFSLDSNRQRRADMDAGLRELGADTDSMLYKGGKLAGEIAGTAGAGGAVANVLGRTGAVSAPMLAAIRSSGFSAPGASLGTRSVGGAVSGFASAGLVNPEDATTGAVIGGALPGVTRLAGAAGQKAGSVLRGPEQSADIADAVRAAQSAGYVIPPTQAKPTLGNRMIEGLAGKLTTAQNASARNQEVTNKLAARALGLGDDVKITPDVLDDVRKEAGKAYRELADLPIRPAQAPNSLTNTPAAPAIKPAELVFDLRKARNDATAWFRSYGRTADPDSLVKAQTAKAEATRIENLLESYAKALGKDDLVSEMAKSRQLIAKTYTVEGALNQTTGSVNALKLAKDLEKGKPLSGELKQAAEFAQRFKTAAKMPEGMGSLPQTSPLDWMSAAGIAGITQSPLGLLSVGARPAARALALSGPVQRGLLQAPPTQSLLANPDLLQFGYRAAPVLMADQ